MSGVTVRVPEGFQAKPGEGEKKRNDTRPVTERVKTFEDACAELGEDNHLVQQYRLIEEHADFTADAHDLFAYLKLRIVTAALNEGWQPKFTQDEWRWWPWFCLLTDVWMSIRSDEWKQKHALKVFDGYRGEWSGFAFEDSNRTHSSAHLGVGSRLCYKSQELADYSGHQFADLWADFCLIRKAI